MDGAQLAVVLAEINDFPGKNAFAHCSKIGNWRKGGEYYVLVLADVVIKFYDPSLIMIGEADLQQDRTRSHSVRRASQTIPGFIPLERSVESDPLNTIANHFLERYAEECGYTLDDILGDRRQDYPASIIIEGNSGVSLQELLADPPNAANRPSSAVVKQFIGDLLSLHRTGIMHGDIHSGNVTLDDPQAEAKTEGASRRMSLIDYGHCRLSHTGQIKGADYSNLSSYVAPEAQDRNGSFSGPANDLYALGKCLQKLGLDESFNPLLRASKEEEPHQRIRKSLAAMRQLGINPATIDNIIPYYRQSLGLDPSQLQQRSHEHLRSVIDQAKTQLKNIVSTAEINKTKTYLSALEHTLTALSLQARLADNLLRQSQHLLTDETLDCWQLLRDLAYQSTAIYSQLGSDEYPIDSFETHALSIKKCETKQQQLKQRYENNPVLHQHRSRWGRAVNSTFSCILLSPVLLIVYLVRLVRVASGRTRWHGSFFIPRSVIKARKVLWKTHQVKRTRIACR